MTHLPCKLQQLGLCQHSPPFRFPLRQRRMPDPQWSLMVVILPALRHAAGCSCAWTKMTGHTCVRLHALTGI